VCGNENGVPVHEKEALDLFRAMGLTGEDDEVVGTNVIFSMIFGIQDPEVKDLLGLIWLIHVSYQVPIKYLLDPSLVDVTKAVNQEVVDVTTPVNQKVEVTVPWAELALLAKFLCIGTRNPAPYIQVRSKVDGDYSLEVKKLRQVTLDMTNAELDGVTTEDGRLTFSPIKTKSDERKATLLKVGIGQITTFTLLQFIDLGCLCDRGEDTITADGKTIPGVTTTYPVWYSQPSFNTRVVTNVARIHSDGETPGIMDSLLGEELNTDTFGITEYTVSPYRIGLPINLATELELKDSSGLSAVVTPSAATGLKPAMAVIPRLVTSEDVKTCFERMYGHDFGKCFVFHDDPDNLELNPIAKGLVALKHLLAVMDKSFGQIEDESSIDHLYRYLCMRVQKVFKISKGSMSLGSELSSSPGDKFLRCRILSRVLNSQVSLGLIDGVGRTGAAICTLSHKFPEIEKNQMLNPVAGGNPEGEIKYSHLSRRPNVNAIAPNRKGKTPGKDSPITNADARRLVDVSKMIQHSVSRSLRRSLMDSVYSLIHELDQMTREEKQQLLLPGELQDTPTDLVKMVKNLPKMKEERRLRKLVKKVIEFMTKNPEVLEFQAAVKSSSWQDAETFHKAYRYQTRQPDNRFLAHYLCAIAQCLADFDFSGEATTFLDSMQFCLSYTPERESTRKSPIDNVYDKWRFVCEREKIDDGKAVYREISDITADELANASVFKVCLPGHIKWSAIA
jgi:hypothetical protein